MSEPLISAIGQLAGTGITGIVAAIFLYLYIMERKTSRAEAHARIEDVQKFNTLAMTIQKEVITAVQALTKIANHLERQDEEKDRLARELALRTGDTGQFKTVASPPRPPRPRGQRREDDGDE